MSNKVTLQPSGNEFQLKDGDNILDGALEHGVSFPYGCQNGFCGNCKAKVSGDFSYQDDYKPDVLTADEVADGVVICCKAEANSDLVVEVHEVAGADEIEVRTMPVKVSRIEQLADDVMRIFLKQPEEDTLQFLAGQYIEIIMEDESRRAFSIANAPHNDSEIELHIRMVEGGKFTPHVFKDMQEKEILRIEGPLGTFFLREDSDNDIVLVAGGTGFAPIKGMVEHAIELGLENKIFIYWGARDLQDLYLNSLAEEWAEQHENIRYIPVLSDASDEAAWDGRTGYVHEAVSADHPDMFNIDVYMAGPPVMVDSGKREFLLCNISPDNLHSDSFEIAGKSE
mgnify:FL=1